MGQLALALPNDFSIVAIADRQLAGLGALFEGAGSARIPFKARTAAERNVLAARLDAAVIQADRAVLLVAHGASCFATAWWARLSPASYVSRVAGALFFEPIEGDETSVGNLLDTFASPRSALPFPSIVLGGETAPKDLRPQIRALAQSWGSRVVIGGHVEIDSPISRTRRAIERFTSAMVERDMRVADALLGPPVFPFRVR
ncbi:alpha/beta hydrolase [Sphingomonas sp. JC676]|uniref:alpha/beta hydrolase n=1 Tax=Sphingomonas sp. JC676 TaxID=2768065 RepID=UPI0016580D07|nr:alpha/beta hydrolase [Sphingomonas sp. JC676]MBC9033410.1 alpha/beta hydrolase [Sphingomonas sp. JC676]